MSGSSKRVVAALFAGIVFGAGLVIGGMTQASKVIGFLDVAGDWDPSLGLVMAGAIAVFLPALVAIRKRGTPVFDLQFSLPARRDIDARLLLGSAVFGVGWGLAGYCPGPALTSVGSLAPDALLFTGAMVFGFGLKRGFDAWRTQSASKTSSPSQPVFEK